MKDGYITRDQRKKILLLCDDVRMNSGIATMAREFVLGLAHRYNWVQLAGSVTHPEKGKIVDLSSAANNECGLTDASIKLYPIDGYGNPEILRQVMAIEKPDAILHFTDPRFWIWLYQIEREIRQVCPIAYLNICDALPAPMYNRAYYESCDLLLSISKQTYNINRAVLGAENCRDINGKQLGEGKPKSTNSPILHYCPHGINPVHFKPLATGDAKVEELRSKLFKGAKYDFVAFYNNRNIRRKQTSTLLLAWRAFCDNLQPHERKKVALLLHTAPVDENGTDLIACKEAFCPTDNVVFSTDKVDPATMNALYNLADVTINIADSEGFGLGTAESLMAGTPIIVTATGGLQDQCGFRDENGKLPEFSAEWGSNHDGRYKDHGDWVTPIFPAARMVQGSIPTPFIFAEYARWEDAAERLMHWYLTSPEDRELRGQHGRDYCLGEGGLNSENMCRTMAEGLDAMLATWKGRERFNLHRHDEYTGHHMPNGNLGFTIPTIDRENVLARKWS